MPLFRVKDWFFEKNSKRCGMSGGHLVTSLGGSSTSTKNVIKGGGQLVYGRFSV
jgi:hypothetical protein